MMWWTTPAPGIECAKQEQFGFHFHFRRPLWSAHRR